MKESGAYERFVRPLLFSLDPETAHHLAINCLRLASRFSPALALFRSFEPPAKPVHLFGLTFRNPVGLAAGFDKNGVALARMGRAGFRLCRNRNCDRQTAAWEFEAENLPLP